jgi:hypothetical protein
MEVTCSVRSCSGIVIPNKETFLEGKDFLKLTEQAQFQGKARPRTDREDEEGE